jgi:putative FmdB family regulatory protein
MPVYEFYCADCHTIFNFLSRRVNTEKRPDCPRCGRPGLERQVSFFAVSRGQKDEPSEELPDLDGAKLEKALQSLAGEMEGVSEDDPRQMARIMRKLSEATGMKLGSGMEEAISRLAAGEDPEAIEVELGELINAENPFADDGIKGLKRKFTPPDHDDTLHVL